MITLESKGSFDKTEAFLKKMSRPNFRDILSEYGQKGVSALASATPVKTGLTSRSWDYEIEIKDGSYSIIWTNDNIVENVSVAILLQYGHATGTNGYVDGLDYINPSIKPIFDDIAENVWRVVKSA